MTSYLPNQFRVLRHVDRIYARDLPINICFSIESAPDKGSDETGTRLEDDGTPVSASSPPDTGSPQSSRLARVHSAFLSSSSSSSSSSSASSSRNASKTSGSAHERHGHSAHKTPLSRPQSHKNHTHTSVTYHLGCEPDAFFVLRTATVLYPHNDKDTFSGATTNNDSETAHITRGEVLYMSEVCHQSRCPSWRRLPAYVQDGAVSPHMIWWELYYTAESLRCHDEARLHKLVSAHLTELAVPLRATSTSTPRDGVLIQRVCLPLSALTFLGTEASVVDATLPPLTVDTALIPAATSFSPPQGPLAVSSREQLCSVPARSVAGSPLPLHLLFACVDGVFGYSPAATQRALSTFTPHAKLPAPSSASSSSALPPNVPWLASPSGESPYLVTTAAAAAASSGVPPVSASAVTAGDLKTMATACATWQNVLQLSQARRAEALDALDARAAETEKERRTAAEVARLEQAVSDEQEGLTLLTLRVEALRQRVAEREAQLQRRRDEITKHTQNSDARAADGGGASSSSLVTAQELQRADVRAQLGDARRTHLQSLRRLFPVELASDREYASPAYRSTRRAKDVIGGCMLPIAIVLGTSHGHEGGGSGAVGGGGGRDRYYHGPHSGSEALTFSEEVPNSGAGSSPFSSASSAAGAGGAGLPTETPRPAMRLHTDAHLTLSAGTADEAHEEARALALVAHAISLLAVLYGCALPHPVLLAGAQSRVLIRADARPCDVTPLPTSTGAAVLSAGAAVLLPSSNLLLPGGPTQSVPVSQHSLPFLVGKPADQPLVAAAIQLLHRDAMVVAERMGLDAAVETCGLRLGAVVHILLDG